MFFIVNFVQVYKNYKKNIKRFKSKTKRIVRNALEKWRKNEYK